MSETWGRDDMPVEMAVWRLTNEGPERVQPTRIESERSLEDAICADLSLIDDGLRCAR